MLLLLLISSYFMLVIHPSQMPSFSILCHFVFSAASFSVLCSSSISSVILYYLFFQFLFSAPSLSVFCLFILCSLFHYSLFPAPPFSVLPFFILWSQLLLLCFLLLHSQFSTFSLSVFCFHWIGPLADSVYKSWWLWLCMSSPSSSTRTDRAGDF